MTSPTSSRVGERDNGRGLRGRLGRRASARPARSGRAIGPGRSRMAMITMTGPAGIALLALILFPVVYAIVLSTVEWTPAQGFGEFTGFSNLQRMVEDAQFWDSLRITLTLYVSLLVCQTCIGLYLGQLLDRQIRARQFVQAFLLLPSMIAPVAISLLWLLLYNPQFGLANYLLNLVGLSGLPWLGDPSTVLMSIAIVDIWQWSPFMGLLMFAGMRALPKEPFEAAIMDGASPRQTFFRVTLPLLKPIIFVAILIRSVDLLRFFDTIYVLTQGGPLDASLTLNIYAYRRGFQYFDMSYAATLMLTLLLLVIVIAGLITFLRRRYADAA
ncbi:sugar ABC transporter permease [Actinobacteria bacterium YIM 96077]|uniref:Sugar ABC transporter permease n=1 Tax=Phytoactinopolyspora halophila TaxID=1981511 RepID=A0A329R465_9ACTN|nr:sugar ABC transporter permease [Phytoactinopolyspora halophila]AYY11709.1 sugar ABC transporter permease [Actinobacteria bacterium YIM 96077]RAW17858.1 sugar ABC transporter permease [Phytoactinopolyspora halophila]